METNETEPWLYTIVRRDLPAEAIGCQSQHAASEAPNGRIVPKTTRLGWLGVADEAELITICKALGAAGIEHAAVWETDGGFAGQLMAIGYFGEREKVRGILAHLKRFKFSKSV